MQALRLSVSTQWLQWLKDLHLICQQICMMGIAGKMLSSTFGAGKARTALRICASAGITLIA
jgi:hypothetical protein